MLLKRSNLTQYDQGIDRDRPSVRLNFHRIDVDFTNCRIFQAYFPQGDQNVGQSFPVNRRHPPKGFQDLSSPNFFHHLHGIPAGQRGHPENHIFQGLRVNAP